MRLQQIEHARQHLRRTVAYGSEDIIVVMLFQDTLRAAIPHQIDDLEVLRERRDLLAISTRDAGEHRAWILTLNDSAVVSKELLPACTFIEVDGPHFHAANAARRIHLLEQDVRGRLRRQAKHGGGTAQESRDADRQFRWFIRREGLTSEQSAKTYRSKQKPFHCDRLSLLLNASGFCGSLPDSA